MEQQPFESQLALVRCPGPMGKASVAAFRRPPSRAVRDFRAVYFYFMFQIALLRQGTASAMPNQRLLNAALAAEVFSVLYRRRMAVCNVRATKP